MAAPQRTASHRGYATASATVFTAIALLQAWRAFAGLPVVVANTSIPVAASWVAAVVAGLLAAWGWRTR